MSDQQLKHQCLLEEIKNSATPSGLAPSRTWTVDADLRITSSSFPLNDQGTQHGERFLRDYLPDDDATREIISAHERALAGEHHLHRVTLGGVAYEFDLSPLYGANNCVIGCLTVATNISERIRNKQELSESRRFRYALMALWDKVLRHRGTDDVYERIVQIATDTVPGAETAALWMRKPNDLFSPVAAVGFNMASFSRLEFAEETFIERTRNPATAEQFADYAKRFPQDMKIIRAAGRIEDITASVYMPVYVSGTLSGFMSLHSYTPGASFSEDAADMTRVFAYQLGNMFEQASLQSELEQHRTELSELVQDYRRLAVFSAEIEVMDDVDALVQFGLDALLNILNFDTAVFGEVFENTLVLTRLRGKRTFALTAGVGVQMDISESAHGEAVKTRSHVYIDNYSTYEKQTPEGRAAGLQNLLVFPVVLDDEVRYTISFTTLRLREGPTDHQVQIARTFVMRLENALERVFHINQIEASRDATFSILGRALEFRDAETSGHTDRVIALTRRFAKYLNLSSEQRRNFLWGAYLHDIGKLGIPDSILQKPGPLDSREFLVIKEHTLFGVLMLEGIEFIPEDTLGIIRSHHERWDGSGYPDGLAGEDIPYLARAFALIDVYDALTHERFYKEAWAHERAVEEILSHSGTHFDPSLTGVFLTMANGMRGEE